MDIVAAQQAVHRSQDLLAQKGTPFYAAASVRQRYDPIRGAHNWKPDNTRRLRAGLGRAAAGGQASIIVIGDSFGAGAINGQGSGEWDRLHAFPIVMRDHLAGKGIPTAGTGLVRIVENTVVDYRWTSSGTWTNQKAYATGAAGATATLTPDRSGAGVCVMYYGNGGRFTISVNGASSGAGFADITAPNDGVWRKAVLLPGGVVAGTAALVLTVVSGTLITTGAEVWTPNAGLTVHNIAQGGASVVGTDQTAWANLNPTGSLLPAYMYVGGNPRAVTDAAFASGTNVLASATGFNTVTDLGKEIILLNSVHFVPNNTYITGFVDSTHATMSNNAIASATGQIAQFGRYPDAVIIELGGNDHPNQTGGQLVADIITGLATIIAQWPNSDVIIVIENQLNSATLVPDVDWEEYCSAQYDLAEQLDLPIFDVRHRIGNYNTAVSTGVAGDNAGHMKAGAYVNIGKALADLVSA